MPRFLKGTTDHDSDGKMGGSLKETKMAKAPKKPAAKKATPDKAGATAKESAHTAQTGMEQGPDATEQERAVQSMFDTADEQVGRQIRGW